MTQNLETEFYILWDNALYTNFSVSFYKNEECCEFLIDENEKYFLDDFTVV